MPHYKNFASSEIFERMTKQVAGRALRAGSRAWRRSAAARLTGPARLSAPIAKLRRLAMTCGAVPAAQLGGVLAQGHVADPVQAVLDRPVPADEVGEPGGRACWNDRLVMA